MTWATPTLAIIAAGLISSSLAACVSSHEDRDALDTTSSTSWRVAAPSIFEAGMTSEQVAVAASQHGLVRVVESDWLNQGDLGWRFDEFYARDPESPDPHYALDYNKQGYLYRVSVGTSLPEPALPLPYYMIVIKEEPTP